MVCTFCGNPTQVINSRNRKRLNQKWRRRQCKECGAVFTTIEIVDTASALRAQRGNDYEPFLRDKVFLSLYDSLRHRKTAVEDATALTETIMGILTSHGAPLIDRDEIVKVSVEVLQRFDKVAAALYQALHPYSSVAK
jgi:transcriptional regulator NrdR family protein